MNNYVNFVQPILFWSDDQCMDNAVLEANTAPPVYDLLPYNQHPTMKYESLADWEELMFLYINRDLWGFTNA